MVLITLSRIDSMTTRTIIENYIVKRIHSDGALTDIKTFAFLEEAEEYSTHNLTTKTGEKIKTRIVSRRTTTVVEEAVI